MHGSGRLLGREPALELSLISLALFCRQGVDQRSEGGSVHAAGDGGGVRPAGLDTVTGSHKRRRVVSPASATRRREQIRRELRG